VVEIPISQNTAIQTTGGGYVKYSPQTPAADRNILRVLSASLLPMNND
jgi:hypothetical protein